MPYRRKKLTFAISSPDELLLLLARLMGQYCFARWCLLSVGVVCNAAGGRARRARGRSGGRHCTAGQYGYDPLVRHLV